jgi:hypothetical protein
VAEQPQASSSDSTRSSAAPGLGDTLDALRSEAQANVQSMHASLGALRDLVLADLALARAALAHTLVFAAIVVSLGVSAWLLLMALLVAALQALGLSWLVALLCAALLSLAGTVFAAIAAKRSFAHTGLHATRRQLAGLVPQKRAPEADSP